MDAASDLEWPDGAVPIYHAAFEQPFSADNLDTLGSWLRNFSLDDDRRIVVGHLETEKFALKQSAVSVEERGFEFLWVSDDLDIVSTIYRPSDPKTSTGVPAGLGDLLHRHADFVWEAMTTALSSLVIAGTASVYARPGSPAAAQEVGQAIARYGDGGTPIRAVMLDRLGPNVWHDSPASAMAVLEELEETARLVLLPPPGATAAEPLTEAQIDELRQTFGARW